MYEFKVKKEGGRLAAVLQPCCFLSLPSREEGAPASWNGRKRESGEKEERERERERESEKERVRVKLFLESRLCTYRGLHYTEKSLSRLGREGKRSYFY